MRGRFVFAISAFAVSLLVGIGFFGEAPLWADNGNKSSRELASDADVSNLSSESASDPDALIEPQGTEVGNNTFYGQNAGSAITIGEDNSFFGYKAGQANTDGERNTFIGRRSGINNVSGRWNAFLGSDSGLNNTGSYNTFVGGFAGCQNDDGERNTFVGYSSGYYITSQDDNTMVGYHAGWYNKGKNNAFFGSSAGQSNSNYGEAHYAISNTLIGTEAGKEITEGDYNTIVGSEAGKGITIGANNTFLGTKSGINNTEGDNNVFVGYESGYSNQSGEKNTFIGYWSGYSNSSGEGNVFLGYYAGALETGSNKLYINNNGQSTPLIWGDFDTNNVVIYGGFRSIASYISSDERLKKEIKPLASSLEKVSRLKGVRYEWKRDEHPDVGFQEGEQIGLVAQNVEKVLPELVSEDRDGYKAVSYSRLTAVLVEAIKELKAANEQQMIQNKQQQEEIEELRAIIAELKG